ncbi:hypothetical protein L336_0467 [Candidatus Saccharimonas aalborgensis]|uniref:Endonuclease/exonuclease/phosphatase domain-containing protein n=2 Tax=Candidatus Saccharimonas aalborgensis TaxID=1332188 RepID=R4PKU0_9BACT|nr:hypothetical protein L336_0467 [Candidatus Saccharimonas aalborgensis]
MSLNMWQGRLERVLLKHLENSGVDFACMQEAVDYDGQSLGLITSYQKVGKSLGLHEQFFSKLISSKLGDKELAFGNAIYSNIPFMQTSTVFTRGEYKNDFNFDEDDYNIRAFQHVQVVIGGKKLNILNHHGHHIDSHKLGDEETMRQVKQLCDYIKGLDGSVILCGDFNLAPESESIKLIDSCLDNLSVKHSLKTTRSKLTYKNEVCDYIFASSDIKVNSFMMDETIISDHNALILDFDLV